MADYLNSDYLWGVNAKNIGNLSAAQQAGLASLAPQSGLGLQTNPTETALDPMANLPTPNLVSTPQIGDAFQGVESFDNFSQMPSSIPTPTQQPYFDPFYPVESLKAEEEYLTPQIEAGAAQAQQSRGLEYSGLGQYMTQDALNYLHQIAPQVTDQEAEAMDMSRLYGPDIADSLISGSKNNGMANSVNIPSSIPGATAVAAGAPVSEAAIETLPSNPSGVQQNLINEMTRQAGGALPGYGMTNFATGQQYETPGYFYNPNQMPDASTMPWLGGSTGVNGGYGGFRALAFGAPTGG